MHLMVVLTVILTPGIIYCCSVVVVVMMMMTFFVSHPSSSQVRQLSLAETWMVLGPDLVGWKLTEARVWAMLRDEEALQARRSAIVKPSAFQK